jgi:hypothetical protein
MNNGKQKALPRWDTPPKIEDYDARKERPDAGMILKRPGARNQMLRELFKKAPPQ